MVNRTQIKLASVHITNFRSLLDVTVDLDDYTVLIGANGAGKSSLLYALDWFFGGRALDSGDRSSSAEGGAPIRVAVTFSVQGEYLGRSFAPWVREGKVTVAREWLDPKSEAWVASKPVCSAFRRIREGTGVADKRREYRDVRAEPEFSSLPELPGNASRSVIFEALEGWENAQNGLPLGTVAVDPTLLTELLDAVNFVVIPASTDMAEAIVDGRSSLIDRLTGSLLSDRAEAVCRTWATQNQEALQELSDNLDAEMSRSTERQTELVNAELVGLAPDIAVSVRPVDTVDASRWLPSSAPPVHTEVRVRGQARPTGKHGHGVQRAVMMAMLQAATTFERAAADADADTAPSDVNDRRSMMSRTLVVAVEEPEIYQHPQRARQIAGALQALASRGQAQLLIASHSPIFVRSDQFPRLRRFSLHGDQTQIEQSSVERVATLLVPSSDGQAVSPRREQAEQSRVDRRLATELTPAVAEAFFADRVLLVEGPTDQLVVEFIAENLDIDLAALGVVIVCISKDGMALTASILRSLGVQTYELFDGDALGFQRPGRGTPDERRERHHSSTTKMLDRLNALDCQCIHGTFPAAAGGPTTVTDLFAVLHDDLEHELSAWESYQASRQSAGFEERSKDQAQVKRILLEARIDDCPSALCRLVSTALRGLGPSAFEREAPPCIESPSDLHPSETSVTTSQREPLRLDF